MRQAAPQMRVFVGARLFDGERLREGLALVTRGAAIVALVAQAHRPQGEVVDLGGGVLAPGFVDLQVHGGGGHGFDEAPAPRTIAAIAAAHRRFGTTALAPTLTSDAPTVRAAALAAGRLPLPGSLGLHVALSLAGAQGARPLADAEVGALIAARVRLVTLAPGAASTAQIRRLAQAGIAVALGGAGADASEVRAAFDAGARAATPCLLASSAPACGSALADAALEDARVTICLIGDVWRGDATAARRVCARAGAPRLALASAAPRDGDSALAGSTITLYDAVGKAAQLLGAPLEEALRMATSNPARLLGVADRHGVLRAGARADLVHLDDDLALRGVWFGGERVE